MVAADINQKLLSLVSRQIKTSQREQAEHNLRSKYSFHNIAKVKCSKYWSLYNAFNSNISYKFTPIEIYKREI